MANKAELLKRCEELGIPTEDLTNNDQREAAIKAKEAQLAAASEKEDAEENKTINVEEPGAEAAEESEEESAEEEASEEKEVPVWTDDRDRKWRFKESAPKTINIDGSPMSQEEIMETEEVIAELVYGKNNFLTQITE